MITGMAPSTVNVRQVVVAAVAVRGIRTANAMAALLETGSRDLHVEKQIVDGWPDLETNAP